MATEPHSANKSVALFTSKPMVFVNAATIRPATITLDRLFFRLWRPPRECWWLFATLQVWIKVRNHQLLDAIAKDQCDADHEVINPSHHLGDGFGRNALGREGQVHDHQKALKTSATNDEAANASELAQHHRNDADQPKFPDQACKPTFNPSRRDGPIIRCSLINRI